MDEGIWGVVILVGVVLAVIYLFPKMAERLPKTAEQAGRTVEHFKIGRLRAQAELRKVQQELDGTVKVDAAPVSPKV